MSQKDYTTKLLDLEGVIVEDIEEDDSAIRLSLKLERRTQFCPCCGTATSHIHDYRERTIRDLVLRGKPVTLRYRRRRFVCPSCGKRFAEACSFAGKYQRFTHRVTLKINYPMAICPALRFTAAVLSETLTPFPFHPRMCVDT